MSRSEPALVPAATRDATPVEVVPEYRPIPASAWKCTLVITNYNGLTNLKTYLPINMIAVRESPHCDEVIVVDDGSTDDSVDFLRANFPDVRVIAMDRNRGFGDAANQGFQAASNPYVTNISNDMVITAQFFEILFTNMVSPEIFAVTARLVDPDGRLQRGRTLPFFIGDFRMWKILSLEPRVSMREHDRVYMHFCGAIGLFDRQIFLDLGGFDDLFLPFYVEENDLCYRAWKRGYRVLYEPRAWVMHYHHESGTIRHAFSRDIRRVQYRKNRFLFLWKNLTSPHYIALHVLWLAVSFCVAWLTGNTVFYRALRLAYRERDRVAERRRQEVPFFVHSDSEVFTFFAGEFAIPRDLDAVGPPTGKLLKTRSDPVV